jgi:hypothetical protein
MALSGSAAMVLFYGIEEQAIADHDHWHTHEHFPERLGVPGFLRASRWVAVEAEPRYLVLYEVEEVAVLSGAPYLQRLNNPTPWTTRMMPSFRGMVRGFCAVTASAGDGLGHALVSLRYSVKPGAEAGLQQWLAGDVLPALAARPGLASAHLLAPAAQPPMTKEQGIRGRDADMPLVLLATGYDADALAAAVVERLPDAELARHGAAAAPLRGRYRLDLVQAAG